MDKDGAVPGSQDGRYARALYAYISDWHFALHHALLGEVVPAALALRVLDVPPGVAADLAILVARAQASSFPDA